MVSKAVHIVFRSQQLSGEDVMADHLERSAQVAADMSSEAVRLLTVNCGVGSFNHERPYVEAQLLSSRR